MSKRSRSVAIFFSIFFSLYGIINTYIFIHGLNSAPDKFFIPFIITYWILALSFIAGRFLERKKITWYSTLLIWIGSFWLAAMLYFFLIVLIIDIILLADLVFKFYPETFNNEYIFYASTIFVVLIILAGFLNARNTRIKKLHLKVNKSLGGKKYIIAAVSDIHLGTIIGNKRLKRLVGKINSQKPDIVLFPGDVVDEDITPVLRQNSGEHLKAIKARLGVYSITGNHEYIGGADKAVKYLRDHNVNVLRDDAVLIDDTFYLIGREDRSVNNFADKKRKPLSELVQNLENSKMRLLLDHQPYHLEEAVKNNIDIQLSGHTHHAQLWPLSFITKRLYEVSYGYKKKGDTHIYVSCGAGTWGPPVRTSSSPEIMIITIEGN